MTFLYSQLFGTWFDSVGLCLDYYRFQAASEIYGVGKNIEAFFETLVQTYLPSYVDFIHRDIPSPVGSTGSLETNGDAPRQKKRRSPAPDASRDSPLHFS